MLEFKKILWPNDFSDSSVKALPYVRDLIERYDSEVYMLHVPMDLSAYGGYWGKPDPEHVEAMHEFALRGAEKKMHEFCEEELASCRLYFVKVEFGDPAGEILKAVDDTGADVIVLPIHDSSGDSHVGSVASEVIRKSPVPVLTINPKVCRLTTKTC